MTAQRYAAFSCPVNLKIIDKPAVAVGFHRHTDIQPIPVFSNHTLRNMCFPVQPTNRPTTSAKVRIYSGINKEYADKFRPTTTQNTYNNWRNETQSIEARKTKNQPKPTKNQRRNTPTNENQRPFISSIYLYIIYLYIMSHEKCACWLVGWSVGRTFSDFSRLVNKKLFFTFRGHGGFFDKSRGGHRYVMTSPEYFIYYFYKVTFALVYPFSHRASSLPRSWCWPY